ncbi:MAG: hypothetical protein ACYSWO_22035 [Planctomycetota bacterium]|jgi:hypothetical protein
MYKKTILWCVVVGLGVTALSEGGYGADKAVDQDAEVKKLLLSPAAEPVPAMAYRLLPRQLDKKTGNAALLYGTAAAVCPNGEDGDLHDNIDKWQNMAVDELPLDEVKKALWPFSSSFHHVALAAKRSYCQWDMPIEDGMSMHLPNLGTYRRIVKAMRLQIRLKIADGQLDEGLEMLQHSMQMGRNIADGPTLVQDLVGVAITVLSLREVEGLMQQPDSPNMYWALTALPDPMIDMYTALEYEREMVFIEFPGLKDIEDQVLTPAQAREIVAGFTDKVTSLSGPGGELPLEGVLPVAWIMMHYSDAKEFLASRGFSNKRIEAMPAAQAVMIYQKQEYQEMLDSLFKWFAFPYHISRPHLEAGEELFGRHQRKKGIKANLFSVLLPALYRVAFLQARLDRHIAILRTVEAIRMHSAAHSGQLPKSLKEITVVPIPSDPVTGGQFIYRRTDTRNARLEAPKSPAETKRRPVYELTVRR